MPSYSLEKLLNGFLEEWEFIKKRSPQTVNNYEFYLRRFLRWSKIKKPSELTDRLIDNWEVYLSDLRPHDKALSLSTINYHLIALRNWLKYLALYGVNTKINTRISLHKISKRPRSLTSLAMVNKLVRSAVSHQGDPPLIQARDRSLISLLADTGLHLAEIPALKKDDLRATSIQLERKYGSNKLSLSTETVHQLKRYLQLRHDHNPYLFVSHDRALTMRASKKFQPLTTRSVQRLIEKYARLAGLKLTARDLRRTFALRVLTGDNDQERAKKLLGYQAQTPLHYLIKKK